MGVRDKILAAKANERLVSLPEGDVLVRGQTVAARDAVQRAVADGGWVREGMLRFCCYDPETGERLFGADDDLANLPAHVVEPLINAITELSALTPEEIEELEGN